MTVKEYIKKFNPNKDPLIKIQKFKNIESYSFKFDNYQIVGRQFDKNLNIILIVKELI